MTAEHLKQPHNLHAVELFNTLNPKFSGHGDVYKETMRARLVIGGARVVDRFQRITPRIHTSAADDHRDQIRTMLAIAGDSSVDLFNAAQPTFRSTRRDAHKEVIKARLAMGGADAVARFNTQQIQLRSSRLDEVTIDQIRATLAIGGEDSVALYQQINPRFSVSNHKDRELIRAQLALGGTRAIERFNTMAIQLSPFLGDDDKDKIKVALALGVDASVELFNTLTPLLGERNSLHQAQIRAMLAARGRKAFEDFDSMRPQFRHNISPTAKDRIKGILAIAPTYQEHPAVDTHESRGALPDGNEHVTSLADMSSTTPAGFSLPGAALGDVIDNGRFDISAGFFVGGVLGGTLFN